MDPEDGVCYREDRTLTLLSVGLCHRVPKLSFRGEGGSLRNMKAPLFLDFSGYIEPYGDLNPSQQFKYLLCSHFPNLTFLAWSSLRVLS